MTTARAREARSETERTGDGDGEAEAGGSVGKGAAESEVGASAGGERGSGSGAGAGAEEGGVTLVATRGAGAMRGSDSRGHGARMLRPTPAHPRNQRPRPRRLRRAAMTPAKAGVNACAMVAKWRAAEPVLTTQVGGFTLNLLLLPCASVRVFYLKVSHAQCRLSACSQ
jgi:hypothetical protein